MSQSAKPSKPRKPRVAKEPKKLKPIKWSGIMSPPDFDLCIRRKQGYYDIVRNVAGGWVLYVPKRKPDGTWSNAWDRERIELGNISRDEAQKIAEERIREDELPHSKVADE